MPRNLAKQTIRKILLIRPDNVGDMVFATALLSGLKTAFPQATLSVLLKTNAADLVTYHPLVDQVLLDWYEQGKINNRRDEKRYAQFLAAQGFDVAINLLFHENRYADLARWAKIPHRLGDKSILAQGWKYNDGVYLPWKDLTHHEIEYLFDLMAPLGISLDRDALPPMSLAHPPAAAAHVKELLSSHGFLPQQDCLIGIHPGTSGGNKPWYLGGFANLIHQLYQSHRAKFLLTGGKGDTELTQSLYTQAKALGTPAKHLLDLGDALSLSELTALFTFLSLYIGGDTGPTHIASALGLPVIDIFPSKQKKPARWGPWRTRHAVIKPISACPESCHPRICPLDLCQQEIPVSSIYSAAQTLLDGGGLVTHEETFYDWVKKTISSLWLVGHIPAQQIPAWGDLLTHVTQEGWHVTLQCETIDHPLATLARRLKVPTYTFPIRMTRESFRALRNLIVKEDINLFHHLHRSRTLATELPRLLAALHIPNAPLPLTDTTPPPTLRALFARYRATFQESSVRNQQYATA